MHIHTTEPWWPSDNTLASNAENPGSTLDYSDVWRLFSSWSTTGRIRGFQSRLKASFKIDISNALLYNPHTCRPTVTLKILHNQLVK